MIGRLVVTCRPPSEQIMKVTGCDKTFVRTFVPQIQRHIVHISIIQQILTLNSFSFERLPYKDDRNYRSHLQLIYL
jgi:hypothetical protein